MVTIKSLPSSKAVCKLSPNSPSGHLTTSVLVSNSPYPLNLAETGRHQCLIIIVSSTTGTHVVRWMESTFNLLPVKIFVRQLNGPLAWPCLLVWGGHRILYMVYPLITTKPFFLKRNIALGRWWRNRHQRFRKTCYLSAILLVWFWVFFNI